MNVLSDLAKSLTPPQPYTGWDYDGLEYRWNNFVFRPALFKVESFLVAGLAAYLVWFFIGKALTGHVQPP